MFNEPKNGVSPNHDGTSVIFRVPGKHFNHSLHIGPTILITSYIATLSCFYVNNDNIIVT